MNMNEIIFEKVLKQSMICKQVIPVKVLLQSPSELFKGKMLL